MTDIYLAPVNPYEERERKHLMEQIQKEGEQLAARIAKTEVCFPRRVVFVPKEENGKVGSLELQFEQNPLIQEIIDKHTKHWQDMIDEHNKKYGFESIKM